MGIVVVEVVPLPVVILHPESVLVKKEVNLFQSKS